jgi:hypothetical protein
MERRASPPGHDAARLRFRRDPQKPDPLNELEGPTGGKGTSLTGCGKTLIHAGFWEGHDFKSCRKSLKMCPRFSAWGVLRAPSKKIQSAKL